MVTREERQGSQKKRRRGRRGHRYTRGSPRRGPGRTEGERVESALQVCGVMFPPRWLLPGDARQFFRGLSARIKQLCVSSIPVWSSKALCEREQIIASLMRWPLCPWLFLCTALMKSQNTFKLAPLELQCWGSWRGTGQSF